MRPPVDPGPGRYVFAPGDLAPGDEHLGRGADLEPATLLAAYRAGAFPMGTDLERPHVIDWWSPDPRGVLLPGALRVSRSMRRSAKRFRVTFDRAFAEVVEACGDPARPGAWITDPIRRAYQLLFELGWAHSVECWADDRLVGGLYGVAVGGLFAGESMFHHSTDASKVALMALAQVWFGDGDPRRLVDVQWSTPHLAGLGVADVDRGDYLQRLDVATRVPHLVWPTSP